MEKEDWWVRTSWVDRSVSSISRKSTPLEVNHPNFAVNGQLIRRCYVLSTRALPNHRHAPKVLYCPEPDEYSNPTRMSVCRARGGKESLPYISGSMVVTWPLAYVIQKEEKRSEVQQIYWVSVKAELLGVFPIRCPLFPLLWTQALSVCPTQIMRYTSVVQLLRKILLWFGFWCLSITVLAIVRLALVLFPKKKCQVTLRNHLRDN